MKKPFKKLSLDKKTILTLSQASIIRGGGGETSGSTAEACGLPPNTRCCPTQTDGK